MHTEDWAEHWMRKMNLDDFLAMAEELAEKGERANQIEQALREGHVQTPLQKADFEPEYLREIRRMVIRAVYLRWTTEQAPSSLKEIFHLVNELVHEYISLGQWPSRWQPPSKRTVDRRTNECSDFRFWKDEGSTPIIALTAGTYCPNPVRFDAETKERILQIVIHYQRKRDA